MNIEAGLRDTEDIEERAMAEWVLAEDNPSVIEVELTEAYEESLRVEAVKADDADDVSDEEDFYEVVEHPEGDDAMRKFAAYVHTQRHKFPASVVTKAESLFADIRQHRSRSKHSHQTMLASFFSSPTSSC